eukprot:322174_1
MQSKMNVAHLILKRRTASVLLTLVGSITSWLSLRYLYIKLKRYYLGLPVHGPVGIPLFGCMHPILSYFIYNEKNLISYGKKYEVFTARMGLKDVVVINDYDLARKLYSNKSCKFGITLPNNPGLLWGNVQPILFGNDNWKERRQMIMNYIMSQHKTQYIDEIFTKHYQTLIRPLLDECIATNRPWENITNQIMRISYIITANLVFQDTFDTNNEQHMKAIETMYETGVSFHLKHFYPHLHHYYFPKWVSYYLFGISYSSTCPQPFWTKKIFPILNKNLLTIKQSYNKEKKPKVYFDYALHVQHEGIGTSSYKPADDVILADAYAIIEGKVTSLPTRCAWAIYLLALFPEVYDKLYKEIVAVYPNRKFSFKTSSKCHYLRAFIYESIRLATFARLDIGRIVMNKNGLDMMTKTGKRYVLPKGTLVKINKCYLDYHAKYFECADTLYLEHHIVDNKFVVHPYFASFGIGPRVCAGQSVVIKEMMILFSNLILDDYQFELTADDPRKASMSLPMYQRKISAFNRSDAYNAAVMIKKKK